MNDKINLIDKRAGEMMADEKEILKTLIDEKAYQIVELTKNKPMTTKELANSMNVKTSNLYYPIKKLLDINALKIVEEKQVKNMTEYYYSSEHLNNEAINIDAETFNTKFEEIISYITLENSRIIDTLTADMERYKNMSQEEIEKKKEINNGMFSSIILNLSYDDWMAAMNEAREVFQKYESKTSTDHTYEYQINLGSYKRTDKS